MIGRQVKVENTNQVLAKSALQLKEVQNFSPRSKDIQKLQEIDNVTRAKGLGSTASFENMVPNYANINNTHTVE